jgi:hypothetical protein
MKPKSTDGKLGVGEEGGSGEGQTAAVVTSLQPVLLHANAVLQHLHVVARLHTTANIRLLQEKGRAGGGGIFSN